MVELIWLGACVEIAFGGVARSKQLAVRSKERMRAVEIPDRNVMGHDAAKSLAGKPGVEVKCRRLDLE